MIAETIPGLESLSSEQQMLLAGELWERAAGVVDDARDDAIHALLQKRLAIFSAQPETGGTWEELRARFLKRHDA